MKLFEFYGKVENDGKTQQVYCLYRFDSWCHPATREEPEDSGCEVDPKVLVIDQNLIADKDPFWDGFFEENPIWEKLVEYASDIINESEYEMEKKLAEMEDVLEKELEAREDIEL